MFHVDAASIGAARDDGGGRMTGRTVVAVARALPAEAIAVLEADGAELRVSPHDRPLAPDELRALAAGADALVAFLHDRVDGALLDAAGPRLGCVANVAVGFDNVDLASARERGVIVTNTPGVLTDATADLTLALMLAATRRIGEGERMIRAGEPWAWALDFLTGPSLHGKLLGVVGLGEIGQAVARRARAFGMEIAYSGRRPVAPEIAAELGGARRLELDELIAASDVLTLHCPLTEATHHLLDARRLALMKPTAVLVNTARGPIVDEAALAAALQVGTIRAAALDVFEREPAVEPALLACENAVLTPHLGSATIETRTAMASLAAENVRAVLAGRPPLTPVG
jgi:glyoxylate reductase